MTHKCNIRFVFITCIVILTSCAVQQNQKWIAPPYTSVDKIIKVKEGMSIEEVNNVLGINPYDIYILQDKGASILIYNYRIKDREMEVPSNYNQRTKFIHSEEAQTSGEIRYKTDGNILYAFFKDGKLETMLTDAGKDNSEYLLLINNNVGILSKKELDKLKVMKIGNIYVLDKPEHSVTIIGDGQKIFKKRDTKHSDVIAKPEKLPSFDLFNDKIKIGIFSGLTLAGAKENNSHIDITGRSARLPFIIYTDFILSEKISLSFELGIKPSRIYYYYPDTIYYYYSNTNYASVFRIPVPPLVKYNIINNQNTNCFVVGGPYLSKFISQSGFDFGIALGGGAEYLLNNKISLNAQLRYNQGLVRKGYFKYNSFDFCVGTSYNF